MKKQLTFASVEHEQFYTEQLAKCRYNDCYHRALIYTLGITEDIRRHFNEVYDIAKDQIKPRFKNRDWVTGTDYKVLKLAFNLFNSSNKCDVSDVFRFGDVSEYLLNSIALRWELI